MFPKPYFDAQKYAGSVNLGTNAIDGVLRESTDLIGYKDNYYPSLALRAYLLANNTDKITLTNKYIVVNKTGLKIPAFQKKGVLDIK